MEARSTHTRRSHGALPFLTSWDPSDLPGTSVDPLGFDRGYNCLADKILPGLTNVASMPRYVSLLCAGVSLGPETATPTRAEVQARQDALLRLERFWALANVLAAEGRGPSAMGIRGITYAEARRDELAGKKLRSTGSGFPLLSRQVQYGVIGMYANVASGMGLIDRKTLGLSSEFGERLAQAFLDETEAPKSLTAAVRAPEDEVGLDPLRSWGRLAHVAAPPRKEERRLLGRALRSNGVRERMAELLARRPRRDGEGELDRLGRIRERLAARDQDLAEAIAAIEAYERCYRLAVLVLDRVLWRCNAQGAVIEADLAADPVLADAARLAPGAVARLERALERATTLEFRRELSRLDDVRAFLVRFGSKPCTGREVLGVVLDRHADVQKGKFDRGRRKLPWVERVEGVVALTVARGPESGREPRRYQDVPPHAYRTATADAFMRAEAGEPP